MEENFSSNNDELNNTEPSSNFDISFTKGVILFLVGFAGLQFVAIILSFIATLIFDIEELQIVNPEKVQIIMGYINCFSYAIILVTLFAIIGFSNLKFIYKHEELLNKIGKGIGYGFGLLMISYIWGIISSFISPEITTNENESSIRTIISTLPIAAFLFVVVFAPVTEEITYRLGIFHNIKKKNRYAAYIATALIFGAIHVSWESFSDMSKAEVINELLNFPSYILSGAYLCYVYEKEDNLLSSTIAHMTNNGVAFLLTCLSSILPEGDASTSSTLSSLIRLMM